MHVLKNKNYYAVLPKCSQEARTLIVYLLKLVHPKELKHAKMSKMEVNPYEIATAGTLKRRGL